MTLYVIFITSGYVDEIFFMDAYSSKVNSAQIGA